MIRSIRTLAKKLNTEIKRLFPEDMQILAEPGRFLVANTCTLVAKVVGKAVRDGKPCYYINDGVYHTYSGQVFDHINYPVLSFKGRGDPDLRGLRADLRCIRHYHALCRTARS